MTNREWLLNKIQNMSDEELGKGVADSSLMVEVLDCVKENERCRRFDGCNSCVTNWLKQEHKEKITLSEAEHIILENIDKNYKWIARDEDNEIRVFNKQPKEDTDCRIWVCGMGEENARLSAFNHLFQFITWEDGEPYNIEELLKGE